MRQTKYMMSGGLAFAEEKDMKKLRRLSLRGWHVSDFTFMGYMLTKGESSDYIYSLDYRSLKEEEEEEYFDFFFSAGWSHVASEANMHLFRAHPGTQPIYTDSETTVEKYKNSSSSLINTVLPLLFLTVLAWIGFMISSGTLQSILLTAALMISVITITAFWTFIATYTNRWSAQGRKSSMYFAKMIPYLLLLTIVMMVFAAAGTGFTFRLLAAMVIGGIAVPTAIRIIMFFIVQRG